MGAVAVGPAAAAELESGRAASVELAVGVLPAGAGVRPPVDDEAGAGEEAAGVAVQGYLLD